MRVRSKLGCLVATLTLGALAFAGAPAASASAETLDDAQEAAIRANMSEGGIDPLTQIALIEKIEAGTAPDSMSGAEPVQITESETETEIRTTRIFADGSRNWIEVQKPTSGARASIDSCSTSGGWKVGCRVGIYDIISSAVFVIDYQTSSSGSAKLRDMRSKNCTNLGGPCKVDGSIKRATQSSAGPAWAELTYSASAGPVNVSGAFGIRVSNSSVNTY